MPCGGLSEWWYSKPPLAVFVLTLTACALTLITISIYVNIHQDNLPDPNVKDWNSFFGRLSNVDLCLPESLASDQPYVRHVAGDEVATVQAVKLPNETSYTVLVTVSAEGDGRPAVAAVLQRHRLQLTLTEELLGKRVPMGHKSDELLLSFGLPDFNAAPVNKRKNMKSRPAPAAAPALDGADGGPVDACITFTGPPNLLPDSPVMPPSCQQIKRVTRVIAALGGPGGPCNATDAVHRLTLQQRPHLTPLLSPDETLLIQLHLVYTTSALVLLVVLLLGYAVVRRCGSGSPHSSNLLLPPPDTL